MNNLIRGLASFCRALGVLLWSLVGLLSCPLVLYLVWQATVYYYDKLPAFMKWVIGKWT